GRNPRLVAGRRLRRPGRCVPDAEIWLAGSLLAWCAFDSADLRRARGIAGKPEIPCGARARRRTARVAGAVAIGAGGDLPRRDLPDCGDRRNAKHDRHVAWSALSTRFADDLDHGVPQPVCDLRSDRLDTDRDAQAWRDLRS